MITKTQAIVLRTVDFKESSLIATLFTRKHGTVAVIAKGARRPKSKFAALLVPAQALEVVFYLKTTRSVQTLSDATPLVKLDSLRHDIEKMALAVTVMELSGQVLHENEVNEELFDFLLNLLQWMNGRAEVSRKMFPYIQLRILDRIGIGLQTDETLLSEVRSKGYINIQTGSFSAEPEGDQAVLLSDNQFEYLKQAVTSKKTSIFEKNLPNSELSELIEYLDRYIRYHVEGVQPRKSDEIFEKILNH
ncbi:MAG: DNA repair protein RecO [Balneolaceae bacterium]|nr:DNA repair protein RecO [Balneolaceae bacterium]